MSTAARKARKRAGVRFYKEPKVKTHEIRSLRPRRTLDKQVSGILSCIYAGWLDRTR